MYAKHDRGGDEVECFHTGSSSISPPVVVWYYCSGERGLFHDDVSEQHKGGII